MNKAREEILVRNRGTSTHWVFLVDLHEVTHGYMLRNPPSALPCLGRSSVAEGLEGVSQKKWFRGNKFTTFYCIKNLKGTEHKC